MAYSCLCHLKNECASGLQMVFVSCCPAGYTSSHLKEEIHLAGKEKCLFNSFCLKSEGWKSYILHGLKEGNLTHNILKSNIGVVQGVHKVTISSLTH